MSEVNFRPAHDTSTDTEWLLPEVVLTQFVSPDDEHDVLETFRDLKIKVTWHSYRQEGQLPEVVLKQFVSPDDEHDVLEHVES